ncbi:MAG: 3-oxoacyl-[acyl-carrier-protein] reductase [Deltaproteobacteria bacterium]|jgi:3-oxoacyl-[acyl-carrier protein] reductase|nr:3-oxoacyl-[acyl-carrier-protein] reductase [Deltaproteobacteria bacterium]
MSELTPTALVTGGSRGIGRAIAMALGEQGLQVYLTYASKAAEAEAVAAEIIAKGGQAKAFALNVGNADAIAAFFQNEIKDKVLLSALVNNAGITKDGFMLRMKDEDWDSVLGVNLRGPFICLREAAKIMTRQRCGRIVNIVSVVGQMGNAGQANYSAAKAGLIGLTKAAAKELAARNITVNAVAPGFISTDMTDALGEDVQAQYLAQIPLKRFGTVQDIADAVTFLVSDKAGYITGQVLSVNGGMYC